jgi:hypothetical protein
MIFDMDGEDLGERLEAGAFRHGPGLESAVSFEAEVVVEAGGVVALHAKKLSGRRGSGSGGRLGLRCFVKRSFARVFFE